MITPGVEVLGQLELENSLEKVHYTHLISIGNPRSLFTINRPDTKMPSSFEGHFKRILRLSFYDVESKHHLRLRQFPRIIPRRSHVRKAIGFFEKTRSDADGYTIHCWQGISRSAAFALGFLYLIAESEEEALRILKAVRPEAHPNQRIVELFDEALGSNLSAVNRLLHKDWIEKTKKELDLTEDSLLEELKSPE